MTGFTGSRWMLGVVAAVGVAAAGLAIAQPNDGAPARTPATAALERAVAAERAFDYESAATQYLVAIALDPQTPGVMDGLKRVAGKSNRDGARLAVPSLREALSREKQRADALADQIRTLEQTVRSQQMRIDAVERDIRQAVPQAEPFGQRLEREVEDLRRMLSAFERETSRLGREIDRIWSRIR